MKRKRIRLIIIIFICILCLAMLIIGPILLQQYIGHVEQVSDELSRVVGQNIILCWLGAILVSAPILTLTVVCLILLVRKILSKRNENNNDNI